MGPITVTIWRESSVPCCLPSLYKEAIKDDSLKQTAVWLQKGRNTQCSGHELKWGAARGQTSRKEWIYLWSTLLCSTGIDRDLGKWNQGSAANSRVGPILEGQTSTTSGSKVEQERQQPDHSRISYMEQKSSHAPLWTAYVLITWGVHDAKHTQK